jgi:type IV pilus assembly protein PilA
MVETLRLKLKEQKGFTLIELLAVIVILGIIAAIAIPAIGNVINKSDNKAKVQDALLIIDAAKLYVADNPTSFPATSAGSNTIITLKGTTADASDATTFTSLGLDTYLDRVKDENFKVTVNAVLKADNTVKYTYSIANHGAVAVINNSTDPVGTATSVTEKQLSAYKK